MKTENYSASISSEPKEEVQQHSFRHVDLEYIHFQTLKRVLFKGIISKQVVVEKDGVKLSKHASPEFTKEISTFLKDSITLTEDMSHIHVDKDHAYLNEKTIETISEILKEIARAKGIIDAKYNTVKGILGNPVSELEYGANNGFIKRYDGGAIFLSPKGIAHEVHGAIYQRYLSLNAEAGLLGYPETDETSTTLGTGRFNHFQGGSIYWSPRSGAWELHGAIRDKWFTLFADRSFLGFPTSNEEDFKGNEGRISHFENGTIIFTWSDLNTTVTSDAVVNQLSLSASSVTCNLEFSMNSKGDWNYKGHMHNSGFVGFNVTVFTTLRFQNAKGDIFGVNVERHLDGTTSLGGDRSDDWNQVGQGEQFIIDNWDTLRFAGIHSVLDVNVTLGDIIQLIGAALPIAVGAVILGALFSGGKICPPRGQMRRNPETGRDEPSVTMEVVPADGQCPSQP
jgi:hypothetical protein